MSQGMASNAGLRGPASATDNAIARYDGTTGRVVQNSAVTIDDSGNIAGIATLTATILNGAIKSEVGYFTRDLTAGAGDVAITGVGFQPTFIFFWGCVDGGTSACWGVGGSVNYVTFNLGATFTAVLASCLHLNSSVNHSQYALVKSLDAGGFTLTWTLENDPTGMAYINYIAIK